MKRSVRRPTEDIALARVTQHEKRNPRGNPTLLQKIVTNGDGTKYTVWCFHTKVDIPISHLWSLWQSVGGDLGVRFVDFLQDYGIIYQYRKV